LEIFGKDGEKEENQEVPGLYCSKWNAFEGAFQILISPDPDPSRA